MFKATISGKKDLLAFMGVAPVAWGVEINQPALI
jgi:hypothetical protein